MSRRYHQRALDAHISRLGYQALRGGIEYLEPRVLLARASLVGDVVDAASLQGEIDLPILEMGVANLDTVAANDGPAGTTTLETQTLTDAQTSLALRTISSAQLDTSIHQAATGIRLFVSSDVKDFARSVDHVVRLTNIQDSANIRIAKIDESVHLTEYIDRLDNNIENNSQHTSAEHDTEKPRSLGDGDQANTIDETQARSTALHEQISVKQGPSVSKALLATARAMTASGEQGARSESIASHATGQGPHDEAGPPADSVLLSSTLDADYPTGRGAEAQADSASSAGGFSDSFAASGAQVNGHGTVMQESMLGDTSTTQQLSLAPAALLTVSLGQPLSRLAVSLDGSATATPAVTGGGPVAGSLNAKRRRNRRDTTKRSKRTPDDTDSMAVPARLPRDLESTERPSRSPWSPPVERHQTAWLFDAALVSLSNSPEPRDTPSQLDRVLQEPSGSDGALVPLEILALGSSGAALTRGVLWLAKERLIRDRTMASPALPIYNGPTLARNV